MKEYKVMITESVVMIGKVMANSREEAEQLAAKDALQKAQNGR